MEIFCNSYWHCDCELIVIIVYSFECETKKKNTTLLSVELWAVTCLQTPYITFIFFGIGSEHSLFQSHKNICFEVIQNDSKSGCSRQEKRSVIKFSVKYQPVSFNR